jgi:hypothetical protein
LSNAALKYEEKSKTEIAWYAVEQDKMRLPLIAAIPQVVEQAKYKKKIYNYTPH